MSRSLSVFVSNPSLFFFAQHPSLEVAHEFGVRQGIVREWFDEDRFAARPVSAQNIGEDLIANHRYPRSLESEFSGSFAECSGKRFPARAATNHPDRQNLEFDAPTFDPVRCGIGDDSHRDVRGSHHVCPLERFGQITLKTERHERIVNVDQQPLEPMNAHPFGGDLERSIQTVGGGEEFQHDGSRPSYCAMTAHIRPVTPTSRRYEKN
jgi:hypothetical protein